jgi:hypothetical protein
MKVNIPYKLKEKFLSLEGLSSHTAIHELAAIGAYNKVSFPGKTTNQVDLDLSNEPELIEVCIEWNRLIQTYFKSSYKAFRIDIGPYEGIWPTEISPDGMVHFHIDAVYPDRKDWKDWFIKEDFNYAPK